ncbi:MAG: rRNA pseudouridine synthase [Verrucomicrobia bacterium]|nr:rRNA pseudouridine synthase [Verrucomicrobiota bacterium]MBS0645381.1 rRNA pseudouridine synthase [Verrucomicrobiota bacterium]
MKLRLNKALAPIASRRAAEKLIEQGRVTLNGELVSHPAHFVEIGVDTLCVDGEPVRQEEKKVYFLLNKPPGYLCTAQEGPAKRVLDIFEHLPYRLFTVGRLDRETSGLIIVTNDGEFAQTLIHPSFEHHKEYLAKVSQEISDTHLKTISQGVIIQGCAVRPISVTKIRRGTLKIVIAEGKKHEVRELVRAADLSLLDLRRIRIGPLSIGNLPIGGWRELSYKEIEQCMIPASKKNSTLAV